MNTDPLPGQHERAAPCAEAARQVPPRVADPCTIVIFGATGDLTARKLLPALLRLARCRREAA